MNQRPSVCLVMECPPGEMKKQIDKQLHIFEESYGEFLLNWWPLSERYTRQQISRDTAKAGKVDREGESRSKSTSSLDLRTDESNQG